MESIENLKGELRAEQDERQVEINYRKEIQKKLSQAEDAIRKIQSVVDEQAEDSALWCITKNIQEAYIQQELRRLHEAIESNLTVRKALGEKNGTL